MLVELRALNAGRFTFSTIDECVEIDPHLLRSGEILDLRADATRALHELAWKPEVDFPELVRMMVRAEVEALRQ